MTFREFKAWANDRGCDGCWGMVEAAICLHVISEVNKEPFWRHEKCWSECYEEDTVRGIVLPTNAKIKEVCGKDVYVHTGRMILKEWIEQLINKFS